MALHVFKNPPTSIEQQAFRKVPLDTLATTVAVDPNDSEDHKLSVQ